MKHFNLKIRNKTIQWARDIFKSKDSFVILDTETTGLKKTDAIVQIAIIDLDGNILFNSLIKPSKKKSIPFEAFQIHGISFEMVKDSPTLKEVLPQIQLELFFSFIHDR